MKYIYLLLPLITFGCANTNQSLENDAIITAIFTNQEAKELQVILDFFIDEICTSEEIEQSEIASGFDRYMEELQAGVPYGVLDLDFNYKKQVELYDLSVSKEIWRRDTVFNSMDEMRTQNSINLHGKYRAFLDKLGEDKPEIAEYYDHLLSAGTIGVRAQTMLLMFPEKFETNNVGVQLLIAIHYLTLFEGFDH